MLLEPAVGKVDHGYGKLGHCPSFGTWGTVVGRHWRVSPLPSLAVLAERQHEQGRTDMGATEDSKCKTVWRLGKGVTSFHHCCLDSWLGLLLNSLTVGQVHSATVLAGCFPLRTQSECCKHYHVKMKHGIEFLWALELALRKSSSSLKWYSRPPCLALPCGYSTEWCWGRGVVRKVGNNSYQKAEVRGELPGWHLWAGCLPAGSNYI